MQMTLPETKVHAIKLSQNSCEQRFYSYIVRIFMTFNVFERSKDTTGSAEDLT